MAVSDDPTKHHYIPVFYLKGWTGDDGRLERYDRPIPSKIMVRRVSPSEAGWMRDLYTSPGDTAGAQWLEMDIFQVLDSKAAPVLRKMTSEPPQNINGQERSAWTAFIRSLFHRTPANLRGTLASAIEIYQETLETTRDRYASLRTESDPETFEEYKAQLTPAQIRRSALNSLPTIMGNPRIGQFMQDMPTRVFTLPSQARDFLLSDDPIARTNGLQTEDGHFALPISPRKLFVSAWQEKTLDQIGRMKPDEIVRNMNTVAVEGARYFVAARDRAQDRFIRNHFGLNPRKSLLSD